VCKRTQQSTALVALPAEFAIFVVMSHGAIVYGKMKKVQA
jgi:hypothetical protein